MISDKVFVIIYLQCCLTGNDKNSNKIHIILFHELTTLQYLIFINLYP